MLKNKSLYEKYNKVDENKMRNLQNMNLNDMKILIEDF